MAKWIGVDLDGTLAQYQGGMGKAIGEPLPEMMALVKSLISQGIEVRIFTARATDPSQTPTIRGWLARNGLPSLAITNIKDFDCHLMIDDRAARAEWNKGYTCIGCRSEHSRRLAQLGYMPPKINSFVGVI